MAGACSHPRHAGAARALGGLRVDRRERQRRPRRSSRAIPRGGSSRRSIPLLDLAQRQVGAETGTQGWLPIPVHGVRRAPSSTCRRSACSRSRPSTPCSTSRPVGRFHVQVCGTTPCMLRGSDDVLDACYKRGLKKGHTTEDGLFTLDRGRVPRRLRQRADGPDQRRQLRGPDRRQHGRDPRRARRRPRRPGPARRSIARPAAPKAARPRSRKWPSAITIIGGSGDEQACVKIVVAILVILSSPGRSSRACSAWLIGARAWSGWSIYGGVKLLEGPKRSNEHRRHHRRGSSLAFLVFRFVAGHGQVRRARGDRRSPCSISCQGGSADGHDHAARGQGPHLHQPLRLPVGRPEGGAGARRLGRHQEADEARPGRDHRGGQGVGPARPRRRRLPDRA